MSREDTLLGKEAEGVLTWSVVRGVGSDSLVVATASTSERRKVLAA